MSESRILSVNVGSKTRITGESFDSESGIDKRPATGPVTVGELGLESDTIVHTEYHGGLDQAVYVYRQEDYDWWARELGRDLVPGQFGENLTVIGIPTEDPTVGTRIRFDELELEVTAPRIPCQTFAAHLGEKGWVKRFLAARRLGFYCRVLQPGTAVAGMEFTYAANANTNVTVHELANAYEGKPDRTDLVRFLAAPTSKSALDHFQKLLDKS